MYRIVGTIQGVAPILFNRMIDDLEGGSSGRKTVADREQEAEERAYVNKKGVYLPGWNFKQCLLAGCTRAGLKVGRGSMSPYLAASVFPDAELQFVGKKQRDSIHVHWGKRPPKTGGACMIRRPMLNAGWELAFGVNVMDDRRIAEDIRRALDEAGLLVGLGSWRPEYGRFIVTDWKVEKAKA